MLKVFSGWISFFTTFPYKRKLRKNTVQYNSSYIILFSKRAFFDFEARVQTSKIIDRKEFYILLI